MTKSDYELIAGVLKWTAQPDDERENAKWRHIAYSMAETLEKNNPKFDRNKFLIACGICEHKNTELVDDRYDEGLNPTEYCNDCGKKIK